MKKRALAVSTLLFSTGLFADTQAQINQLQSQINALQTQISQMGNSNVSNSVGLDTAAPFGAMSKAEMPQALLKNRSLTDSYWVLGGQIEADAQYWNGSALTTTNNQHYSDGTTVALTKLYLFNEINISQNAMGFLSLKNSLPNNTVSIDRAFLMLGKLDSNAPLFVTVGSTYLPFGNFSGNGPLNNALTTNLFRVSPTNQASLNFGKGPVTLIGSIYNNNSSVNSSTNFLFTGLFNQTIQGYSLALGTSYLSNIVGTNSGLGNAFHTNGSYSSSQPLQSNTNPAWDLNFSFGKAPLSLIGEYVSTLRASTNENQSIGKLSAWMLGTTGKFNYINTLYDWQISYSKTYNMQNVPIPLDGDYEQNLKTATGMKNEWLGSIQGQFWHNVFIGPELTYGSLYNNDHTYTATLDVTAYF